MKIFYILFSIFSFAVFGANVNPRIDCHPDPGPTQTLCEQRSCLWNDTMELFTLNTPQCYFPSNTGYVVQSNNSNNITLIKSSQSVQNPFGQDFNNLQFLYQEIGAGIRLGISPAEVQRYQPPITINKNPQLISSEKLLFQYKNDSIFSFSIVRQRNNVKIWDTSLGGLLFADQYIQIATYLPTDKIYGFGENTHPSLKHNFSDYTTWGMFTRDQPPNSTVFNTHNLYSVHPFYLGLETDGTAHGVFIFNSNAQEVTTGIGPHLIYRTLGGMLEIFFFPGPKPEDVIQQYQEVIGKSFLPAYWNLVSTDQNLIFRVRTEEPNEMFIAVQAHPITNISFGFVLSRAGYKTFTHFTEVVNRTLAAGIPIDTFFVDRDDYMNESNSFFIKPEWNQLPNYTNWLHANNYHLTLNNEPYVEVDVDTFKRGLERNASFFEWPSFEVVPNSTNSKYPLTNGTKLMLANVWPPKHVVFPDFLDKTTRDWYRDEFINFHKQIGFDAIWLDMNEPSVFHTAREGEDKSDYLHCPYNHSNWDYPKYWTISAYQWGLNYSYLFSKSLCMSAVTSRDSKLFYNVKNLFGYGETIAAYEAIKNATGKRSAVIPRSTFPSSGRYGGHWTGDVTSKWEYVSSAIISVQEFNLFGIPYVGSDICGFVGNATEELCLRWQQAGAFHPFSRNHNIDRGTDQDPAHWPSVASATRKANLFRYRHLPYLFSLHFYASIYGGTVIRPVFFEFPNDPMTHDLSYQFLWGPALMIAPVINQGANSTPVYLPSDAIWYSVYDYLYGSLVNNQNMSSFPAPTNYLTPVFVRGGYIIPRQRPSITTTASRQNEFQLLVALDRNLSAVGELYWDDGDSIIPNDNISQHNYHHFYYSFNSNTQNSTLTIVQDHFATNLLLKTLDNIEILGHPYQPILNTITLNEKQIIVDQQISNYDATTKVLNISATGLIDLNNNGSKWVLTWNNDYQSSEKSSSNKNLGFRLIYVIIYLIIMIFI